MEQCQRRCGNCDWYDLTVPLLFGKKELKKATNVALPGAACSKTMVRNVRTTPSALIISVSRQHER